MDYLNGEMIMPPLKVLAALSTFSAQGFTWLFSLRCSSQMRSLDDNPKDKKYKSIVNNGGVCLLGKKTSFVGCTKLH